MALSIKFGLNTSLFQRNLDKARRSLNKFGRFMTSQAAKWSAAFVGIGSAIQGVRGALAVDQLARDMGITTDEAFRLSAAAKASGQSLEDVRAVAKDMGFLNVEDQITRMNEAFDASSEGAVVLGDFIRALGDAYRSMVNKFLKGMALLQKGIDAIAATFASIGIGGERGSAREIFDQMQADRKARVENTSTKSTAVMRGLEDRLRRSVIPGSGKAPGGGNVNSIQRLGGFRGRSTTMKINERIAKATEETAMNIKTGKGPMVA